MQGNSTGGNRLFASAFGRVSARFGQVGALQQVSDHLGVGFADAFDAQGFQVGAVRFRVLDDAVVYQRQFSVIRQVGVGIVTSDAPMCGPTGVPNRGGGVG